MSKQNAPANWAGEDEINLADLWPAIVRHQRLFWGVFGLTVVCGLLYSQLRPTYFSVSSTIEIATLIENNQRIPIESPESVKAKIEMALGPSMQEEAEEYHQQSKLTVAIPRNSNLVFIQNLAEKNSVDTAKKLHRELVSRLTTDHDRMLKQQQVKLQAEMAQANEHLHRLNDERFQLSKKKDLEAKIENAKAALTRMTDPVILDYETKNLEIQLDSEMQKLESLKGQDVLLGQKAVQLETTREMLLRWIDDLKKQTSEPSIYEKMVAEEGPSDSHAFASLLISNDLHLARYRLAELEERLYVQLEVERSALQKAVDENKRSQEHQASIIALQKVNKEKFEIETRLEKAQQIAEISRIEANLAEVDALLERQIALKKLEIDEMQAQLESQLGTRALTMPLRSRTPQGLSSTRIVLIATLVGLILGMLSVWLRSCLTKTTVDRQPSG